MSRERWQLSGNSADFYERYVRRTMEPWIQALLDVADLQPGESVFDLACGPGFVARGAVSRVGPQGRVVGLDLNAGMIAVARAADPTIEWLTGDAGALPFESGTFDVVLCQQGVQFFPDRLRALREARRVLHLGGRLAFTVWRAIHENPYGEALAVALARHLEPSAATPYALHDAEELRTLVTAAGFRKIHVRPTIRMTTIPPLSEFVPGHLAALPQAQDIARLSPDQREAIVQDMTDALRAYIDQGQVIYPSSVHVVTANA